MHKLIKVREVIYAMEVTWLVTRVSMSGVDYAEELLDAPLGRTHKARLERISLFDLALSPNQIS